MQKRFTHFLDKQLKIRSDSRILLAVSGGIDSMVMLNLFSKAKYQMAIAHCNFCLRGTESDGDELFVRQSAEKYDIELHSIKFDTEKYMKENKLSLQMAARELRYNWFYKLCNEHNYSYISIAHHGDDVTETFFLNLMRGTGIVGLSGIKEINDKIIRPLLFTDRDEIIDYAKVNNVHFREDSSNNSTKYSRNKIRHDIIPEFEKINPEFKKQLLQNIDRLKNTAEIYFDKINEEKAKCISRDGENYLFDIKALKKLSPLPAYLFEFLRQFGFNNTHAEEINDALFSESGKKFYSSTHVAVKDRKYLIVSKIDHKKKTACQIPINTTVNSKSSFNLISKGITKNYTFEIIDITADFEIPKTPTIGCFDFDKLSFPLIKRGWKEGDYFFPIGMKQRKKLSDFFIDNKLSLIQKENTDLIISGSDIIWIAGMRVDNRYKITEKTLRVLLVE